MARLPGDGAGVPGPELLPAPSPTQVAGARAAAGHTQAKAAALIGVNRWQTWSEYEGGKSPMPALSWTFYLLATGQHPELQLASRRVAPRSPRK